LGAVPTLMTSNAMFVLALGVFSEFSQGLGSSSC